MNQIEENLLEIEVLKRRFADLIGNAKKSHLSAIKGKSEDEVVETVLYRFMDEERRQEYYKSFKEVSNISDVLSPDPFLRVHIEDVETLARVYRILRGAYWPCISFKRIDS